jgi:transcriptional regulator with XRE-family HTH domain
MPLHEAIRSVARSSEMTQVRLAAVLGVDQRTVSRYYTGENTPAPERLAAIEDACGVARGVIYALSGFATLPGVLSGIGLSRAARKQLLAAYHRAAGAAR